MMRFFVGYIFEIYIRGAVFEEKLVFVLLLYLPSCGIFRGRPVLPTKQCRAVAQSVGVLLKLEWAMFN